MIVILLSYGLAICIALYILFKMVKIVPMDQVFICERLGKYKCTLEPGLHFIVPFLDRVAYIMPMDARDMKVAPHTFQTSDHKQVEQGAVIILKVKDPVKAAYKVNHLYEAVEQLSQTTMRNEIAKRTAAEVAAQKAPLEAALLETAGLSAAGFGIEVNDFKITASDYNEETQFARDID